MTTGVAGRGTGRLSEPEAEPLLESAWRILRRRKWLILQATVIVAVVAFALSATREKEYTASASILFKSATDSVIGNNGVFVDEAREAATNESLLSLGVVAQRASRALNGDISPAAIAGAVSVVSDEESDVMQIEATTTDSRLSARVANAYGSSFIAFRRESAVNRLERAIALAEQAYDDLTPQERDGTEGDALRDRINQLETAASLQTGDAELVQSATAPTEPSAPKPIRNGILGGLLGLVLGFAVAALRERSDRSVYTVEELEAAFDGPVLARIPLSPRLARHDSVLEPRSSEAEAFRMLRASLRYVSVNRHLESVLISSGRPSEGKTTIAWRLAETMALMGDRVVLVEADMYHPRTREQPDHGGLSDVLVGMVDLSEALEEVHLTGPGGEPRSFTVLPRGVLPPNPSELLESSRMADIMSELEDQYDLVIVDTPPIAVLSDALSLISHVSGVIAVAALGKSERGPIGEFVKLVELSGGQLLGVVANLAPSTEREGGHYYYRQR